MKVVHELSTYLLAANAATGTTVNVDGALGEFLGAACPPSEDYGSLLRRAGCLAIFSAAGFQPTTAAPPMSPAPSDDVAGDLPPTIYMRVHRIIDEGNDDMRRELCTLIAESGRRLPDAILPRALDIGRNQTSMRPAIIAALGQRGRWLAAVNPDWRYVQLSATDALSDEDWEHGSSQQRCAWLSAALLRDPVDARARLQREFSTLSARERAALLGVLVNALQPEDEAWLQTLLVDRSREVRQCAIDLLLRLPESAYVARMCARLAACLHQTRHLFKLQFTLEPPELAAVDWKADGIEEARPKSEQLGERAWWLYQIARCVPLSWWQAQMNQTPEEIVKWTKAGDWHKALRRAWEEALSRQPGMDWVDALWPQANTQFWKIQPLVQGLPQESREQLWWHIFQQQKNTKARCEALENWLDLLSRNALPLSPKLAQDLIQVIGNLLKLPDGLSQRYRLASSLRTFASLVPVECLAQAIKLGELKPNDDSIESGLADFLHTCEQRQVINQFFREQKTP